MRTRVALLCLALVAALASAGCGASNAIDPVATAATTSNAAPGFRMTFVMNMTSSLLPQPIVMTGNGAFDTRDRAGQMAFDMNIPELRKVMPSSGGTLHMDFIIRGLTFYMRFPALSSKLPGGRPWVKFDLAKLASKMGLPGLSSFGGSGFADPSQFLQYLRGVSGDVTKVGSGTVAGVPTTHYRTSIDLSKVIDRLSGGNSATIRHLAQMMKNVLHTDHIPIDVWIDANHLVRRLLFKMNLSPSLGQSVAMSMQLTIPEYGPQPEPQAPPASQVTDLGSLLKGAGSGSASGSFF